MDAMRNMGPEGCPPFEVLVPDRQTLGLVLASPHSGTYYPDSFTQISRLDARTLRRSEDTFVDELVDFAPQMGAPLMRAVYPRAYLDLNREPYELDPGMFDDPLPAYVNAGSPRVAAGLGTIAKVVGSGADIYRRKLRFAEALDRIETVYFPYHAALKGLVDRTVSQFGCCILVDCHSMPSGSPGMLVDSKPDMVLGDRHGLSCHPAVTLAVEQVLRAAGYRVARNMPYAGGYTTAHYGRPGARVHALQIEISRHLYMDERTHERLESLETVREGMRAAIKALAALTAADLRPGRAFSLS